MSEEASIDRARLLLADWIGQTTAPDLAEPVPVAPLSSWLHLTNGSQHQLFLKTAPVAQFGWTLQNYDTRVFNFILDFGGVNDGVTDNRTALNNAITVIDAVGGGVLYFPPGQYAINKPNAGTINLIDISNKHNITFLGDGKASQIRLAGTQFSTQTIMIRIHNLSSGIKFVNLFMDSALATNIEATNQNHLTQPQGASADGAGFPPSDIEYWGCYFGQSFGDQIRLAGDDNELLSDVRIYYNSMDGRDAGGARHSRTCVSFQRGVTRIMIVNNFMTGSLNGQLIDMEPSGTAALFDVSIIGNQLDHNTQGSQAIALGGLPSGADDRFVCNFNTIAHGGNIEGLLFGNTTIIGNAVVMDSTSNTEGTYFFQDHTTNLLIQGNVGVITDSTISRISLSLTATATAPLQCSICDNVLRSATLGIAGNGAAFADISAASQLLVSGNIWTGQLATANSAGIKYRSGSVAVGNHVAIVGELAVADAGSAAFTSACQFGASNANNVGDVECQGNYFRTQNATNVVIEFLESGGGVFTAAAWRYCGDNLLIGGAGNITFPASNVGLTGAGTAGPGTQTPIVGATPVGNVQAHAGSLATNQAGGVATTLFVKETGVGVGGGTAGWIGVGGQQINFGAADLGAATTALFLATGSDLAVAKATTVEARLTGTRRVRNWRVKQIAGTGAGSTTFTVRKNNVAQSGSVAISFTSTVAGPAGNFTGVAGDTVSVVLTKSQAPATNPTAVVFSLEITG